MTSRALPILAVLAGLAATGCGGGSSSPAAGGGAGATQTTRVQIVDTPTGRFDAAGVYKRDAPSVVTVLSVFKAGAGGILGGGGGAQAGQGSGFVVSADGEVATNAHVVTSGEAPAPVVKADQVYVKFSDGNEVAAKVVGFDPNADVALLKIEPKGLTLRPLTLGTTRGLTVGEPVAAIGSPFGEAQSLSVGVISATNRSIDSLTGFAISGALQTDAAINHGNSGGPLLNASGQVLGINSQIKSTSGGGEGVGFAVPADTVSRSLDQLRKAGRVRYGFLGVETTDAYPQLSAKYGLGTPHGAWVQKVTAGGPAAKAGIRAGTGTTRFQAQSYRPGGDVIVSVAGKPVEGADDLGRLLAVYAPGDAVTLTIFRGAKKRTLKVTLGERPANTSG